MVAGKPAEFILILRYEESIGHVANRLLSASVGAHVQWSLVSSLTKLSDYPTEVYISLRGRHQHKIVLLYMLFVVQLVRDAESFDGCRLVVGVVRNWDENDVVVGLLFLLN